MGSWQLEIGRMIIYISFPIGMFHFFNHSESIKKELIVQREKYYTPELKKKQEEFIAFKEKFNNERQIKRLKELEEEYYNIQEKSII